MFCPQCGQPQVSDEMRFCSRCGFALAVVTELIAHDGELASHRAENAKPSRRQARMYKGLVLLAGGVLFAIICLAFTKAGAPLEIFAMIGALFSSIVCFFGLFQTLAAYLSDEDVQDERHAFSQKKSGRRAQLDTHASRAALPAAQGTPATDWRPRPQTAEMAQPASVTENTTRLLDDETISRED